MPEIDINRPDVLKFLVENYDKTTRLRLTWNTIHADKLKEAATLHREEKGYRETDVTKAIIDLGMPAVSRDNESDAINRRVKPIRDGVHIPGITDMKKGHSIVELGLGNSKDDPRLGRPDTDLSIDPIMRPVDPKQTEILYQGRPDYGRQVYLQKRCKMAAPEDRYYFAESSSWIYGWRLKDSYFNKHAPDYGRVWQLSREKSRSGPKPDPDHYKSAGQESKKCTI